MYLFPRVEETEKEEEIKKRNKGRKEGKKKEKLCEIIAVSIYTRFTFFFLGKRKIGNKMLSSNLSQINF